MPSPGGQFFSDEFGDIEDYFVSDYQLIDQYIGDQLWTWGSNSNGQLGVNNIVSRSTPVTTILGGTNWKSVDGGGNHITAIKTDESLWLWGLNNNGQLGVNNTTNRSTPVTTILGGNNWKSVAGCLEYTTAIKIDGSLWVWGSNLYGNLGVNDLISRSTPVTTILGGTNWKSVDGGRYHTTAIKTDGSLWNWGRNSNGQLGVNDNVTRSTPVTTILGGTNWKSIACGGYHTAAFKTDGSLWLWGENGFGNLGVNDIVTRSTPVTTILGGSNWKSIDCGDYHTAAIKTDGSLWLWGYNSYGQLGVNDRTIRSTPVTTILGGTNWKYVSGGYLHTIAIKTDGSLWLWGRNQFGQLGVNDNVTRSTPVTTILGGTNWKSIACGDYHTAAITAGVEIDFTPPTEIIFDVPGTYTWYAPVGVTTVSVLCVGGGGGSATGSGGASGGGGGGLGYKNNISVSSGTGYTVVVGSGGAKTNAATRAGTGGTSYFISTVTVAGHGGQGGIQGNAAVGGIGGTYFGDGGGNGGNGGSITGTASAADAAGGGGAGGYSGAGGAGGNVTSGTGQSGSAGTGGGGGGGGACGSADTAGCGGGVGLYGSGSSGNGGAGSSGDGAGGFGGSGGGNAAQASATAPANVYNNTTNPSTPGRYGGGGCGSDVNDIGEVSDGASGAVRIIWADPNSQAATPTFS